MFGMSFLEIVAICLLFTVAGVLALVFYAMLTENSPLPYDCEADEKCKICYGSGIIPLNFKDNVECPCTIEWR